jgi:DNA adenine methylase
MMPLLKWPGGKSGEIEKIEHLIPKFERYIEPFMGGGALFFHLQPESAAINDISNSLMDIYRLVQGQDENFHDILNYYSGSFVKIIDFCNQNYDEILMLYNRARDSKQEKTEIRKSLDPISSFVSNADTVEYPELFCFYPEELKYQILKMASDKFSRTIKNDADHPFSTEDLKSNLITGFASGYYMYFRKIYNDIALGRISNASTQYAAANFYFIREYCYGSMFRYNAKGEFNIPYGGMSYNDKNFAAKINSMFSKETAKAFQGTEIYNLDFADFLTKIVPSEDDFMFLDPPYDTDFSDYEGRSFTHEDQSRLAEILKDTPAKYILIIKSTPFIEHIYEDNCFHILSFDRQYTYNVRSRNDRQAEHLIITNLPVN